MISGTIAGISSFTVYPLGEITILRPSSSYYYISYSPSTASGTMWIKSTSTATPMSYQISSYSGMLKFSGSYPQYLSFESCNWSSIKTNIPMFNESLAFARCSTLQNADLYSCTSLSTNAFLYCSSLSQVSLPMCGYIGSSAFERCTSLIQVSLPMCEYIGYGAFYNCYNLRSINFPVCSYISGYAFTYCYSLSQVSLPVCEYIGEVVFYDCSSLTQIDLPMCSYIGTSAFNTCSSLSQVSLPLCSYIGWGGFAYCSSLESLTIPDSVISIGREAFSDCTSLTTIYYTGIQEQWDEISISSGNDKLENANIVYSYEA